jgi:hypothetical protein
MKTAKLLLITLVLACGTSVRNAEAQRGMGQTVGVAKQAVKPEIVTLSGTLTEIKTGPCEQTTGHSPIGTHLLLKTHKGDVLNIHLGPQAAVADAVAKLSTGKELSILAFRTDKMPEKHYTAQSLTLGETTVTFRDAGLRPVWAGPGGRRGQAATQPVSATKPTVDAAVPAALGCGRAGGPPWAGGAWHGGRGPDAMFQADREIFHSLLEDHQQIRRTVNKRAHGVETLTESDDPNVALAIQGHVAAMHQRVQKILPIHLRDPLFAAVFGSAAKIKMEVTKTSKGVRVVETSDDPYVAKLIQAHAAVVDKFVANGFLEAWQNHSVPEKE